MDDESVRLVNLFTTVMFGCVIRDEMNDLLHIEAIQWRVKQDHE